MMLSVDGFKVVFLKEHNSVYWLEKWPVNQVACSGPTLHCRGASTHLHEESQPTAFIPFIRSFAHALSSFEDPI